MDVLLDRLGELAGHAAAGDASERAAEARMLWRTLEVLVASNSRELRVGDPSFAKLVGCARSAVDDASHWSLPLNLDQSSSASSESHTNVYVFAVRVVAKLATRGEQERNALVDGNIASSIVRSLQRQPSRHHQDAYAVAAALKALAALISSAKHRSSAANGVPLSLEMMTVYPLDVSVQLASCNLLLQLLQDPSGKERLDRIRGVSVVVNALLRFPRELQLAIAGIDVLFLMCTHSWSSSPGSEGFVDLMQDVVTTVVAVLASHRNSVQVAESAAELLNRLMQIQPRVKYALVRSKLWTLARVALDAPSDSAAHSLADALATLVADQQCMGALRESPESAESDEDRSKLQAQLSASGPSKAKPRDVRIEELARSLLSIALAAESDASAHAPGSLTHLFPPQDDDDRRSHFASESSSSSHKDDDLTRIASDSHHVQPTLATDSTPANLLEVETSSPRSSLSSPEGMGFFEQFLLETGLDSESTEPASDPGIAPITESSIANRIPARQSPSEASAPPRISSSSLSSMHHIDDKLFSTDRLKRRIISDASASTQWQEHCQRITREFEQLHTSHNELKDNLRILQRRAAEQTTLLSMQSSRLQHQSHIHQQALERMHMLESELTAMRKKCQVEHELRVAEATQSERISLTLHDAAQEIKALNLQRSNASRELQEKEKMRIDYQQKAAETKLMKQRLEAERDEAMLALQLVQHENAELHLQLQACRREGREALGMREEDVDARKPLVFSEVILRAGSSPLSSATRRGVSALSSANSSGTLTSSRSGDRLVADALSSDSVLHDDLLERIAHEDWPDMSDPKRIDRSEIERCLQSVFELLGRSGDSNGVHIATVRRFFFESGLAQPPSVVAADVDTILAKVLAQSSENSKKTIARKDFAPGQAAPASTRVDVRKYRFFDLAAFNEAVTVVGMKRFPRVDLLRVLQNVVSLYLLPAILSGLALHIGRGNDHRQLAFEGDTSEVRYHSNSNKSGSTATRRREDVVYSMLEMHGVLSREHKPLVAILDFYASLHHVPVSKDELFGLSFELVLGFAIDFEVVPSFMDRISLKHLHSEVAGVVKTYFALHKKVPFAADGETLKRSGFLLVLARVAIELFGAKTEFETPERQISALLQWLDNSAGRDKITRKASLPVAIKFSRRLYTANA